MKFSFFILLILLLFNLCQAQNEKGDGGLGFTYKGEFGKINPLDSIFSSVDSLEKKVKSNRDKKFIFFYFYSPKSSHLLDQFFLDTSVSRLLIKNFICFKTSSVYKSIKPFTSKYRLNSYPAVIIADINLNEIDKLTGSFDEDKLKQHIELSIFENKGLSYYKNSFVNGMRSLDFLYHYTYLLKDANELDSNIISNCIAKMSAKDIVDSNYIKYLHEFMFYNLNAAVYVDNKAYQFYRMHQETVLKYYPIEQIKSNVIWIAMRTANVAIQTKNRNLFIEAINVLQKEDVNKFNAFVNIDGDTVGYITYPDAALYMNIRYNSSMLNMPELKKNFTELNLKYSKDWEALNEFAWSISQERVKDTVLLNEAIKWSKRSIELDRNNYNTDTYATLLYRIGDFKSALILAEESIKIADKLGRNKNNTIILLKKIKEKLN